MTVIFGGTPLVRVLEDIEVPQRNPRIPPAPTGAFHIDITNTIRPTPTGTFRIDTTNTIRPTPVFSSRRKKSEYSRMVSARAKNTLYSEGFINKIVNRENLVGKSFSYIVSSNLGTWRIHGEKVVEYCYNTETVTKIFVPNSLAIKSYPKILNLFRLLMRRLNFTCYRNKNFTILETENLLKVLEPGDHLVIPEYARKPLFTQKQSTKENGEYTQLLLIPDQLFKECEQLHVQEKCKDYIEQIPLHSTFRGSPYYYDWSDTSLGNYYQPPTNSTFRNVHSTSAFFIPEGLGRSIESAYSLAHIPPTSNQASSGELSRVPLRTTPPRPSRW